MSRLGRGFPNNGLMRPVPIMPVTYDATGGGSSPGSNQSSWSWSHTVSGNAVIAVINMEIGGTPTPTMTATVGSTSMPLIGSLTNYYLVSGFYYSLFVFGLMSPPTGSQTVTVTSSVSCAGAANSVSYGGVRSFGTVTTNTGTGTTASISSSSRGGGRILNALGNRGDSSNPFSGYNQTSRYSTVQTNNGFLIGDSPGGSVTFSSTQAVSDPWGALAVPLI